MDIEDFKKAENLVRSIEYISGDLEKINVPFDAKDIFVSVNIDSRRSINPREATMIKMIEVLKIDLEEELKDLNNQLENI